MAKEKSLEKRVQEAKDTIEIINLQSRYQHLLCLGESEKIIELFATELPDVSVEAGDGGVFIGATGIERVFLPYAEFMAKQPGEYTEHRASQPIIEIAGDGKTAKGLWFSCGIMTSGAANMQAWTWGKYYCDYVKLDGKWKIRHMTWYQTFESEYDKGWLYDQACILSPMRVPGLYPPDEPSSRHMPYHPARVNIMGPEPPEPYDSYEE